MEDLSKNLAGSLTDLLVPGGDPFRVNIDNIGSVSYCRVSSTQSTLNSCADSGNAFVVSHPRMPHDDVVIEVSHFALINEAIVPAIFQVTSRALLIVPPILTPTI